MYGDDTYVTKMKLFDQYMNESVTRFKLSKVKFSVVEDSVVQPSPRVWYSSVTDFADMRETWDQCITLMLCLAYITYLRILSSRMWGFVVR